MKCTVDNVFSAKVDTIIRRLRPLERAKRKWNYLELFGTPEGLLERAKRYYPYSKMCELCELCELCVKTAQRFFKN